MIETIADSTDPLVREILALTLPDFVTLEPAKQPITLRYLSGRDVVVADELPGVEFKTATEAYDAVPRKHTDVYLDDSLKHFGKLIGGNLLMSKADHRMLLSYTTVNSEYVLKSDYHAFLKTAAQYRSDPKNWVLAYQFVATHPAFWYVRPDKPYQWVTSRGFQDHAWIHVYMKDDKPQVTLEHGAHVLPACTAFYLDGRISVKTSDLAKAYVKVAKKIDKHFELDGSDKEKENAEG